MELMKNVMRRFDFIEYTLRLFIACGVIFAVRIIADEDRKIRDGGFSAHFIVVNKGRLYGELLMYLENHEYSDCAKMCARHRQCVTINYNAEQKLCELLADRFVDYEAVDEPGWLNYGIPDKVNGGYSSWGHGPCSVTCGHGVKVAWRTCTHPVPKYGGRYCDGIERKTLTCHEKYCPVDGGWSSWQSEGVCSTSCGYGTQQMKRTCTQPEPEHNGSFCHGNDSMSETCLLKYCPIVNLASNKPCTASGSKKVGDIILYPKYAVDGKTNTWFHSNEQGDQYWWTVDFTKYVLIQYIYIHSNYWNTMSNVITVETLRDEKRLSCSRFGNPKTMERYLVQCNNEANVCSKLSISTEGKINLHEVDVYGYYLKDRIDVAKGKETEQSSTEGTHVANYANDNDATTFSTTLDNEGTPPWWYIDLEVLTVLHKVNFHLNDGGDDYAKYHHLIIYTRKNVAEVWSVYENKIFPAEHKFTGMKYSENKEARFLKVTLKKNARLSIREIKIYGFPKST